MTNKVTEKSLPAPISFDPAAMGPLSGVHVIDMSRVVAGNMMTAMLGDLGADIIKVEPFNGDGLRDWRNDGISFHWKVYGRNKRSIALEPRTAEGRDLLLKLIDGTDVFVENFRPGTLEKMGLSPETLLSRNKNLIIVRISGFGQSGPYSQRPGFGTLVEAMSGFASKTGFADREPVLPATSLADMVAGLYGASAVQAALRARDVGKQGGQVIDLSLLEPLYAIIGPDLSIYERTGAIKQRAGSGSHNSSPRNVYRCSDDKYIALSGSTQVMAERVFRAIGAPEMIEDARFRTNADRVAHKTEVDAAISAWFNKKPRGEALAEMLAADVTVGPVYDIADTLADEHFRERQVFVEVEDDELGAVTMQNITPRFSKTPGVWRYPAPEIGQHTDAILSEAGLDHGQIAALRRIGAVK